MLYSITTSAQVAGRNGKNMLFTPIQTTPLIPIPRDSPANVADNSNTTDLLETRQLAGAVTDTKDGLRAMMKIARRASMQL